MKKSLENHPEIVAAIKDNNREMNWHAYTRTQFNLIARIINRKITREVLRQSGSGGNEPDYREAASGKTTFHPEMSDCF